jgi:hypothetical protein
MFYWIYDIPTETLAVMMAGSFALFSWLGSIVVRPILRLFVRSRSSSTNDVVGYILSCYCVFYGLLIGLIAVAAYQNYSEVELNVTRAASSLAALDSDLAAYPEPQRQNLRCLLRSYCQFVIKYAWPQQRRGIVPQAGQARIDAFHEKLLEFEPQTKGEEIVHAETLHQFNVFLEHRQVILHSVTTGIPPVMWYVVIVGAVINIALVWLFDIKFISHLFLGGLLAFYLGTMIFLIAAMDNPFRGEVSVSAEPFERLYKRMLEE